VEGVKVTKLRKLKGQWNIEFGYSASAIDIESEIVDELAKQLQTEMDREMLAKLRTHETRQAFAQEPVMSYEKAARHIDSEDHVPGKHAFWYCLDTKTNVARKSFQSRAQGNFYPFSPLVGFEVYDDAVLWAMTYS
jgi:hypothetical protein